MEAKGIIGILLMLLFSPFTGGGSVQHQPTVTSDTQVAIVKELNNEMRVLSQDEAKKNLDTDKTIILVDVRAYDEYKQKHISGSILIPLDTIEEAVIKKIPDRDSKIYLYCELGGRSKKAYMILQELGYTNLYNIGGINTWKYETVSSN